jgi:ATP-dependent DNA helicase RecG
MFDFIAINNTELNQLIHRKESHFLDFKSKDIAPSKLQNTFVAMANSDGGDLYVGIEDESVADRIKGFLKPEDANQHIQHLLVETKPVVEGVTSEFLVTEKGQYILHFLIPKSDKVHYTSSGECHIRMNAQTTKIKGDDITRLGYAKGFFKFEEQAVTAATVEDILDGTVLSEYMSRVGSIQEEQQFLRRNRLLAEKDGKNIPNVTCVLLFDEEPQDVLPSKSAVKLVRMQTTATEYRREQLDSSETLTGAIEFLAKRTEERIFQVMKESTFMVDGAEVKVNYPIEAVHEILVNAFLHRDYSIADDIHVFVYDNRIVIKSPGRLPGNVTIQNILEAHFSRNPNLVRLVNKLPDPMNHDLGEGLNAAFTAMHRAGLIRPEIIEADNSVVVTLHHQKLDSYEDQIMAYLDENEWITNKIARALTGEDSENKIKKSFEKLRAAGRIAPEDINVSKFRFRYRKS